MLFIGGDYIKRYDFVEEERYIKYKKYQDVKNVIPESYTLHGIDVSRHNGEIWWRKIAEAKIDSHPISFAFMKATEGMFFFDREFTDNWHTARSCGVRRGAYHFYRPKYNARLQAWNFIINVHLKKGDLPPVLDIEGNDQFYHDAEITEGCKIWLNIIEKHYRVKPIIYTNILFFNRVIKDKIEGYPLWIANYRQAKPQLPDSVQWSFWQHSDHGRIVGINENVDLNVFKGDSAALRRLCIP